MHVHQVKTPLSNSYVVTTDDRLLVVDVGLRCHEYVLGFITQELRRDPGDVELIVCTHEDADHMGGVRHLAVACQAAFALPYASRSRIRKHTNDPTGWLIRSATSMVEAARPRAWRMYASPTRRKRVRKRVRTRVDIAPGAVSGLSPDYRLKDGHLVPGFERWEVVHTPGHTWDSCCLFHADSGSLISGDTLLGSARRDRLVLPSVYSNRRQLRRSLQRLSELDPRNIYPGHGRSFHGDGLLQAVRGPTGRRILGEG